MPTRTATTPRKLVLVDGNNQLFRAAFAKGPNLTSPTGEPTKGVYFFFRMLQKLVASQAPTHLAVVFDSPRSTLERRKLWPAYKANRKGTGPPSEITSQFPPLLELLRLLGVRTLTMPGWEGDDVIASMATQFLRNTRKVRGKLTCLVVTRDKDMHQLVSERVSIYDPQTASFIGPTEVRQKWGVPPERVLDIQMLMGDMTDNVKGVRGIGPVMARRLVIEYGSVENVVARITAEDGVPQWVVDGVARADWPLLRSLMALNRDLPLPWALPHCRFWGLDLRSARPFLRRLGIARWSE